MLTERKTGLEVYIEYAIVENFLLDGALLYLAQKTVHLPVGKGRLFLSATCGAAFALVFPFFDLPPVWAFAVRYLFGFLLVLAAVRAKSVGEYFLTTFFFYLYTFSFGGFLLGMYAFFEVEYAAAGGYLISSVPMGAVLAAALAFSIAALRLFAALRRRYRRKKLLYRCKIVLVDGREYAGMGLLDTGNHLLFCGRPVSLVDPAAAERLFGGLPPEEDMPGLSVHTATGDGELKVFPARLMIYSEGRENIIDNVYFALASAPLGKGYDVILHPRLCKEEGTPC